MVVVLHHARHRRAGRPRRTRRRAENRIDALANVLGVEQVQQGEGLDSDRLPVRRMGCVAGSYGVGVIII